MKYADLRERLQFHEKWLRIEIPQSVVSYQRLVEEVIAAARQEIEDAWTASPAENASDMNIGQLSIIREGRAFGGTTEYRANLSAAAQHYLDALGLNVEDLFHHVVATLHDPKYRAANSGALRMEWPRIPLPGWPDVTVDGAADALAASSARGRQLAALLDSDTPVAGVTTGTLRPDLATISVPTVTDGGNMAGDDFAVSAGWGHFGTGDAVMPGQGRVVGREYTANEREVLADGIPVLGETTFDVYLSEKAYWRNVPAAVWNYQLGGYQVLKKWLSYRESKVLGRSLQPEEVQHFTDAARRIASIIELVNLGMEGPHIPQPFPDHPSSKIVAEDSYGDAHAG